MNHPVTQFPQVVSVKNSIDKLKALYARYEQDTAILDLLADEAGCFSVRLPLVGAFSAGKTTLINTLIDDKLFAVEVNPETSLPVELGYAPAAEFTGYTSAGATLPMTRDAVEQQQFSALLPDGWLQVKLPAENLKALGRLTLVDMPGWDSGIAQHSKAIDAYLHRSLAYCVVVSADEGNVRESLRAFIEELALRQMPALVVITKSDKKPQSDVDAVQRQVTEEVTKLLGQPPLGVVQVAARKRRIDGFTELLQSLQERADERFFSAINAPTVKNTLGLEKRLETLINQDNLDAEALQVQKQELEEQLQAFKNKIDTDTLKLDTQAHAAAQHIIKGIESRLLSQVELLASQAMAGNDIQGSIGTTLRMAISEGIRDEFAPALQNYFTQAERDIPESLCLDIDLDISKTLDKSKFKLDQESISKILGFILSTKQTIPGTPLPTKHIPIELIVDLVSGIFSIFSQSKKEEQKRQQLESVKQQIAKRVIPQVQLQVEPVLREQLQAQAEAAKQQVLGAVLEQSEQYQAALAQLEEELKIGQQAFEEKRQGYVEDLDLLKSIQTELLA